MDVKVETCRQIFLGQTVNWSYTGMYLYMSRGLLIPIEISTKFVSRSCPNLSVAGKISYVVEPVPTSITMRLNTMNIKVIINEFLGVILM